MYKCINCWKSSIFTWNPCKDFRILRTWNIGFKILNKVIEEQSTRFFYIYQGKYNASVLLTNEQYTEHTYVFLPMAKCTGEQQELPKLSSKAMEKQSTCFVCITYQGKQNSCVLLTNEWFTEQLEWTKMFPWQNVRVNQSSSHFFVFFFSFFSSFCNTFWNQYNSRVLWWISWKFETPLQHIRAYLWFNFCSNGIKKHQDFQNFQVRSFIMPTG